MVSNDIQRCSVQDEENGSCNYAFLQDIASIASVFDPGVIIPSGLVGYVPDWASSPTDQDEKHVGAHVKDLQTV